jgi:hypothetical protein
MRTSTFIMCSCAVLALGIVNAGAGPCTTEIENLSKMLASKDAGSGPTSGASASSAQAPTTGQAGQHPPTATMSQMTQGQATSPEDVRRQTAGQPTAAGQGAASGGSQHPPTSTMSQATQSQAAPPAASEQHPPTAAMSGATQSQMAPGQGASSGNTMQASAALDRARELDRQGKEAECMDAVRQAKQL